MAEIIVEESSLDGKLSVSVWLRDDGKVCLSLNVGIRSHVMALPTDVANEVADQLILTAKVFG